MGDFKFTVNEAEYARIQKALEQVSQVDQNNILKKGYKEGSKVLIAAGKTSFLTHNKKHKGNLYRSFTDKLKRKKKNASGILVGFKRGKDLGNHSHLIDRGTQDRWVFTRNKKPLKKPAFRGRIDAAGVGRNGYQKTGKTYFWTRVVDAKGQEAMDKIVDAVIEALESIKG